MVSFKVQRASGDLDIGTGSTPNFDKSGGAFRQLKGLGDTVAAQAGKVQKEYENNYLVEAQSNADITWNEQWNDAVLNAPADGAGFANKFTKDYDEWKVKQLDAAKAVSQEAHDKLDASLTSQETQYAIKASNFQAVQLRKSTATGLDKMQEGNVKLVYDNPDQLDFYLKRGNDAIEISNISAAEKVLRRDVLKAQLQQASAQRMVDTNPREALKQSGGRVAPKGNPKYTKFINAASASVKGVSSSYLTTLHGIETSFGKNLSAKTSSAKGHGQFVKQTWLAMLDKHGNGQFDHLSTSQKLALRLGDKNDGLNFYMTAKFAEDNKRSLQKSLGREVSDGELYIAHFMGAGGATRFIKNYEITPNASAAKRFPKEAAANPTIYYTKSGKAKTIAQVYNERVSKFEGRGGGEATGVFADMPLDDRLRFQGAARSSVNNINSAEARQQTQQQNQTYHDIQIGIASNTVSSADINQQYKEGNLSNSQHIKLLSDASNAQSELLAKTQMADTLGRALRGEGSDFDPSNKDQTKALDTLFMDKGSVNDKSIVDAMSEGDAGAASMVTNTAANTGYIPKPATDKLLQMHASGTPDQRNDAYQIYNKLARDNPYLTSLNADLKKISPFAKVYESLLNNGFSQRDAMARIDQINSDEFKKLSGERRTEARKIADEFTETQILESFAPTFYFTSDTSAVFGGGKNAGVLAMHDFKKEFEYQFTLDPDVERAQKRTIDSMSRVWSESTVTGKRTVAKYAVENYAQPVQGYEGGSFKYAEDQLHDDVTEFATANGHEIVDIFMSSDRQTAEDVSNPYIISQEPAGIQGQPNREVVGIKQPSYKVGYTYEDAGGNMMVAAIPNAWRPDPKAAQQTVSNDKAAALSDAGERSNVKSVRAKISGLEDEQSELRPRGRGAAPMTNEQKKQLNQNKTAISNLKKEFAGLVGEDAKALLTEIRTPYNSPTFEGMLLGVDFEGVQRVKEDRNKKTPALNLNSRDQKRGGGK